MSSQHGVPRRRLSPPVGDAPVEALLARVDDLTKGWLLALLEQRDLEDAPAILAVDVVREGPRLCEAIVRALADDHDLRRLESGGALERVASRAGEITGSSTAEQSVRAVDALRSVIWGALRQELVRPNADYVEALAERLALVAELVRAAVLRRFGAAGAATPVEGDAWLPDTGEDGVSAIDAPVLAAGVEDLALVQPSPAGAPRERMSLVADDSLWRGALEDEVARAQRSGAKLALVLAELSAADRASTAEAHHMANETFGRFAQAVRSALRREDILACETQSRAWVIARATGRMGARALASRISRAVQTAEPWRTGPLTVGIGIGILGEDAVDSAGLIEAADELTFDTMSTRIAPADARTWPGHRPGEDDDPANGGRRGVA